jgi:hypothetical protein
MTAWQNLPTDSGLSTITFDDEGDWNAVQRAERWCAACGISVGTMQGKDPRGLRYGEYRIAKWRNLSSDDVAALDGIMKGDMRNGPVTIVIRDRAP